MKVGEASRTAWAAAEFRAAHQVVDGGRVFADPLAVRLLDSRPRDRMPVDPAQPSARATRLFLAARSRFAEDAVAGAVRTGVKRVVVLGAGLDTFAYRNPFPDVRVVEVDHPDTQAWKRELLAQAGIGVPDSVTYAGIDFETQSLVDVLTGERSFFVWLGVVPYLNRAGFDATLRYVAGHPGSEVVFDYTMPPSSMPAVARAALEDQAKQAASVDEPFQTYFRPDDLAAIMRAEGFAVVDDIGPAEMAERWFEAQDAVPAGTPGGHIMHARV
ncbi:SAM-dependent methyltransferase [Actinoplanes bogorensis]|uniref:S-adenosyl-L-methionine-dependent methyltransferase n=1 Tax=Paractinoplanes bogorensis TaxID=1610840 RepID=A0ABS5YTH1_9ACTN|nr:SAM-dependent methyltransferase [Actinoplanes bogorensis]MBU2666366.1 SAM-dependent methyltransferase [Actinoplanes bogorensis]